MEGRKLNFNARLLSVRRYSTMPVVSSDGENGKITGNSRPNRQYTIPFYRSDLSLEQVTEPATVPFLWEQIPGRPKDGALEPQQPEEVSVTPRLPPPRTLDIVKYPLEKEFEDRPQAESCSSNDNVTRLDCFKSGNDEKENSNLDDDDDVYSDALDALSPTDSFSMNCSVSGLSGSDGEAVKPSGKFSTDPQTRDFMMRRFLPAAKAMALETPQYAPRKQPAVAIEQPRVVNKVVSEDRKPPLNQCIVIPHYGQDVEEEESEDEVDEYDETSNISSKACGLLPRLCLNKSLCLLNPVPGLRVRTHSSMSSTSDSEVRQPGKAAYVESHIKTVMKNAGNVVYKHQSDSGGRSPKLLGTENRMTCGSNRFAHANEQQMTNSSSPFRRGISPYRNERPQSPFRGGGFLGVPKETENLKSSRLNLYGRPSSKSQELLPHPRSNKGSGSVSPIVEKTLYIDTVKFAKISSSNSSPSETKGQMESVQVGKGFETSRRSRGTEENASAEFSFQDLKCQYIAKEESILKPKIFGSVEARRSSFSGILHPRSQTDAVECSRLDTGLDQECKSLEYIEVTADGKLNSRSEKNLEVDYPGYINSDFEQSPLPPPLPRMPSESWLWRTLSSVSSQKKQDAKPPLTTTKWETIVKTSHSHHYHARYSEELTAHFSQQSKT